MKQELLKDIAGTISFIPYQANRPVVATSATVTVKNDGGTTVVASTSATVNSTTGEITYQISAAILNTLAENWKAEWVYVISGTNYYQPQLFDVVLHRLSITVVDSDILAEQSDLLERNENTKGTVDSATTTTLVDAELKQFDDDYWNGGILKVINPATSDEQIKVVTDFAQSTGTLTVSTFPTTPTSSYLYIVYRGFKTKVEKAFLEMMFDIRSKGFRPALIIESFELHIPHVKKTLALICRDYSTAPDDKWVLLAALYEKQYIDLMDKLRLQYDVDESGQISGAEKNKDFGSVRLRR